MYLNSQYLFNLFLAGCVQREEGSIFVLNSSEYSSCVKTHVSRSKHVLVGSQTFPC